MNSRIAMFTCLSVMVMLLGCNFTQGQLTPTPNLAVHLSAAQVKAILNCQASIRWEATQYTDQFEDNLNLCLNDVLAAQLEFENGQLPYTAFQNKLNTLRTSCTHQFAEIGAGSTTMINNITNACTSIQSLILPGGPYYDPLLFGALNTTQSAGVTDAAGLAGHLCGADSLFADAFVSVQEPRFVDLLNDLDNNTGQFETNGPTSNIFSFTPTIPNIPLDPGCVYPSLP